MPTIAAANMRSLAVTIEGLARASPFFFGAALSAASDSIEAKSGYSSPA